MKIEKNNFVVTFKTEKEVSDYMGMHIPEEQRLLWLGFFIANNYIAQRLEDDGVELVIQMVKKDQEETRARFEERWDKEDQEAAQ